MNSQTPGVRLHLTGPTVPDLLPARGWVRCRHVSRRTERSTKTAGAPDLLPGPGPPNTIRTPQRGGNRHPAWGGPETPRVRRRRYTRGCQASSERLAHLPHSMRKTISAFYHSRARGDFCQAVLLVARYQGAQYSRWRHSHHARQSLLRQIDTTTQRRSIITPTR